MSEERDRELSRHYRAASAEMPPPSLGRALRAAAAQAVAAPPRRWHRKWGAPLAMAASVVLGLGVVLRVALERPDLQPAPHSALATVPAPAPAVVLRSESVVAPSPAPAAEPAAKAQAEPAATPHADTASKVGRQMTQQPVTSDKKLAPAAPREASLPEAKPQTSPTMEAAAAAAPMRDLARAGPSMRLPPAATAPAAAAPAPASESVGSQAEAMVESTPGRAAGTTANAAVQERRAAPSMAPATRAKALDAGSPQNADFAEPGIAAEALLAPDEWLRRIVILRQAARHAEADASLARFIRRYPDYRIPQQARAPQP